MASCIRFLIYEYDNLYQLIGVNYPDDNNTQDNFLFSFDENGNRTFFKNDFGVISYDYKSVNGQTVTSNITSAINDDVRGKSDLSYDYQGNMTVSDKNAGADNIDNELRTYNALNEVTSYTVTKDGKTTTANYTYDTKGWRIKKQVGSTGTRYYIYEGVNVLCEFLDKDNSGTINNDEGWDYHVYLGLKKVADVRHDGTKEFYVTDHLGSVSLVTDGSGEETQRYIYGPYGNLEYAKGNSDNRYLFQGKEFDVESGDLYFGARYFDPQSGRWQARDPKEQHFSSYVAFGNNPLKFMDPDGEDIILYMNAGSLYAKQVTYTGRIFGGIISSEKVLGEVTFSDGRYYLGNKGYTSLYEIVREDYDNELMTQGKGC